MLKQAIAANAVFSGLSGITLGLMQDWFSQQLPAPAWLLTVISVGLIGFSLQLTLMFRSLAMANKLIVSVIYSDIAWVLISSIALGVFFTSFSEVGIILVLGANLIVATLAWLQFKGNKISRASNSI